MADAKKLHRKAGYKPYTGPLLRGPRSVVVFGQEGYPPALARIPHPPEALYVIGDAGALVEGLAVVGARKATPYGRACARHFAARAAGRGICIISGGAYGCDSEAHRAALGAHGTTVVFLGGGCDQIYPASNHHLFQEVIDGGGAIVSEHAWDFPPLPYTFRERNRLIAGLGRAVLIVEAGLPSGTFSTADEALQANRDVLVIPGAITSKTSAGSNRLLYQGAVPIVDDESFEDALCDLFGFLHQEQVNSSTAPDVGQRDELLEALRAAPMRLDQILSTVPVAVDVALPHDSWLQMHLAELERDGEIARFPDGRYGPARM
jgi:DNA processing protein